MRDDHLNGHVRPVDARHAGGIAVRASGADGKTVVANVQGLILLVSVLAGLGVALIILIINQFGGE
jgi:hypothetical protein